MTRNHRMLAFIESQGRGCTAREVADTLGFDRIKTSRALAEMGADGMVRTEKSTPRLYHFVRYPMTVAERLRRAQAGRDAYNATIRLTDEQRAERMRRANLAYYHRHRERLIAQKRERDRAKRAETAPERAQRAAERRAAREAAYAAQKADRALQAQWKALLRAAAKAPIRQVASASVAAAVELKAAPKVETIRTETVEEWLARGGHVQTLAPHEVSAANQFKRIGRGA